MVSVFLSHSSKDKPFVRELADHLGRDGGIKVWLDERDINFGGNIVAEIGNGLESDFVLLVLSPDSVESRWVKEEWTDAYWDQMHRRKAKLAGVLYRDCPLPPLLRNKKYFDLRKDQFEGFRAIRSWLLSERPAPPTRFNLLPSRPSLFVGRESELAELRTRLTPGRVVSVCGMPGRGKSMLALEFAHRYERDFEAVYWVSCQSQSLPIIAGDLLRQLGLQSDRDIDQIVGELRVELARKRCLLVLDNVEDESPGRLVPGGGASVLVTTRQRDIRFLRTRFGLALDLFSEEQCFALFREVLGEREVEREEVACRKLFTQIGRLPIAVNVLAHLIKEDVRHTIASVAAKLPADATALIEEAIDALPSSPKKLLAAMAACAPEGFRLALVASVAELDEAASLDALQILSSRSLVDEIDRGLRRYRLHALVRAAAGGDLFGTRHAELVNEQFENWEVEWQQCVQHLPDFQTALAWATANGSELDSSFSGSLAYSGYELCRRTGYLAEAMEICRCMAVLSEERGELWGLQASYGNQALILKAWGRLEEALALHKKEEAICLRLGNKSGLGYCYWNWGLVARDQNDFDTEQQKLSSALALFSELGMPRERDAVAAELGKAREAGKSASG